MGISVTMLAYPAARCGDARAIVFHLALEDAVVVAVMNRSEVLLIFHLVFHVLDLSLLRKKSRLRSVFQGDELDSHASNQFLFGRIAFGDHEHL